MRDGVDDKMYDEVGVSTTYKEELGGQVGDRKVLINKIGIEASGAVHITRPNRISRIARRTNLLT